MQVFQRQLLIYTLFLLVIVTIASRSCNIRKVTSHGIDGFVCVCNATYCDTLDDFKVLPGQVITYTSSAGGSRFRPARYDYHNNRLNDGPIATIVINTTQELQTIKGFGAAFTDAAGINLLKLVPAAQEKLLEAYFDPIKGIGYTIGRVPIGSTDFSTRIYSYDDVEKDFKLQNFKLADEDFKLKIPIVKRAQKFASNLSLFGSPWSPPAWMKTAKTQQGKSGLIGDLDGPYYTSWALYFGKFLQEYERNNISFWAITIQNEPSGCYSWQCLLLNGTQEAGFVRKHLRSTIDNAGFKNVQIIANDDARSELLDVTHAFAKDRDAAKLIDGFGTHWYSIANFSLLVEAHDTFPDKFILPTEACNGYQHGQHGAYLGSWVRGVKYAKDIIGNLNAWAVGWVDWNFCLDELGGPNWAGNVVDAPIITNNTEFYKQPMYYVLGHFSRFLSPGSVIVPSVVRNAEGVETASGVTPNGNTILVVLNNKNSTQPLKIVDVVAENEFVLKVEADSITTVVWKSSPKKM
uniref:Glucosylceramidase n=1 Tax=Panagrellus redivivus TaxID=6233 RepID=A0A7E4VQY8_PANRE